MQSIGKSPGDSCEISMLCVFACTNEFQSFVPHMIMWQSYIQSELKHKNVFLRSTLYTYILCLFYGIWQTSFENATNWGIYCTGQSMKPFFSQQIWIFVFQVEDWPWMVDSIAVQQCTRNSRVPGAKWQTVSPYCFQPDCIIIQWR